MIMIPHTRIVPGLAGIAAMLLVLIGCGGGGPPLSPVSGRITVNGEPLANATVIFEPRDADMPQLNSGATTDPNGDFELKATDGRPGAIPGPHKVSINPPIPIVSDPTTDEEFVPYVEGEEPDFVPFEFERVATGSTDAAAARLKPQVVEFTVPEGGTNTANFPIESR